MKMTNVFCTAGLILCALLTLCSRVGAERWVTVQPIQICDDDGQNCAHAGLFEAETNKIWAQADIAIHYLPTKQFNRTDFLHIDASFPGPEEDLTLFGNYPNHGHHEDPTVINMWFVDTLISIGDVRRNGVACGPIFGVCRGSSGVIISGDIYSHNDGLGRIDTIAHEIGHVLGLGHQTLGAGGFENLMSAREDRHPPVSIDGVGPTADDPKALLTDAQIDVAQASSFVLDAPVPEPASRVLMLQLLVFSYAFRHLRQKRAVSDK